jgi:galactose mutarotase-like enzyme
MNENLIYNSSTAFRKYHIPATTVSTFKKSYFLLPAIPMETSSLSLDALEEKEWDAIINNPQVQRSIERLADEALEQFYRGETEEGGFGIE